MAYDAAAGKSLVRAIVHRTFQLAADYRSRVAPLVVVPLHIRWHNKVTPRGDHGDLLDIGYADVIEGVDAVIFNSDELIAQSVVLRAGDTVTLTAPRFNNATLKLDSQHPKAGPQEVIWRVAQTDPPA